MGTKIKPPAKRKARSKGSPPPREDTRENLSKPEPASQVTLTFRVPADFHRDFKISAIQLGMTQRAFLFYLYEKFHKDLG